MSVPNAQIGWSTEAKLINEISKQLDRLIEVCGKGITTTSTTTAAP